MSSERRRRTTLLDVAEAAGVSRTTASRVLNDHEGVRPAVRDRVRDAMARLDYVPDVSARSLRSGRTGVIGLLIGCEPETVFDDAYFAGLVTNLVHAAGRHGHQIAIILDESELDEQPSGGREMPPKVVAGDLFDGVVITATTRHDPLPRALQDDDVPIVVIGDPEDAGLSSADVDNTEGGRVATRHLIDRGRRRIALVSGPRSNASALSRRDGALEVLAAHDLEPVLDVHAAGFTAAAGRQAAATLVRSVAVDAVVAGSDAIAVGVLGHLHEHAAAVPEEVAVVGFDDFSPARLTSPPLTTVRQDLGTIAAEAVALLLERIAGDPGRPTRRIVDVSLVVRGSAP